MRSIRLRLLLVLLFLFLTAWTAVALLTYEETRDEVIEIYDAHLAEAARLLLGISRHEIEEALEAGATPMSREQIDQEVAELEELLLGHPYATGMGFQVWESGNLVLRSSEMPEFALAESDGFADRQIGDTHWRVYRTGIDEFGLHVHVAERLANRERMITAISRQALYPLLVALPVLTLLIWFGVGRGLVPLRAVAREVSRRSPSLLEPVPLDRRVPVEVRPLVNALNDLLGRLDRALERERRFTADASHELRTPLASLKTQAQVALRANDEESRRHALRQVIAGVDRATHLVEQLLTIARLEPEASTPMERVALDAVAADICAELAPAAARKGVKVSLEMQPAVVRGNTVAIGALLRNLIDNAIRHTPEAHQVTVTVSWAEGDAEICVSDEGPGIPAHERERVFDRFYRGENRQGFGCGLGLSIVSRVAELHGARILLDESPGGGLRVRTRFVLAKAGELAGNREGRNPVAPFGRRSDASAQ